MEQANPMNPFALTDKVLADLREKEAPAREALERSIAAHAAQELAYAKCFSPILLSLLSNRGTLTRSDVHSMLVRAGFKPGPTLANDVIQSGVMGDLIVITKESEGSTDATYGPAPRFVELMGSIYFALI